MLEFTDINIPTCSMRGSVLNVQLCFAVPHSPSNRDVVGSISGNKSSNPLATPLNPEDEDREEQKRRDASWKATKYFLIAFGATLGIAGSYTVYELGTRELRRFTVQIMVWVLYLTFKNYKISDSAPACLGLLWVTFIKLNQVGGINSA